MSGKKGLPPSGPPGPFVLIFFKFFFFVNESRGFAQECSKRRSWVSVVCSCNGVLFLNSFLFFFFFFSVPRNFRLLEELEAGEESEREEKEREKEKRSREEKCSRVFEEMRGEERGEKRGGI